MEQTIQPDRLRDVVDEVVTETLLIDIHTHLYPPAFGALNLWGIDELVTYHYLIAELFRFCELKPEQFWAMSKQQQADVIWETLFVRNTPISEAARGVVAVLRAFGLDTAAPDLKQAREFFSSQDPERHVERVLEIARVRELVMTNDPFNDAEARAWIELGNRHPRFRAALRMDPILNDWAVAGAKMSAAGYPVTASLGPGAIAETRRFLDEWITRMRPLYMAVSLPNDFLYPDETVRTRLLREVVLPTARLHNLPFAMMIGVARKVNPLIKDAGDAVGHADIRSVERICREHPTNRFLVTMLSRENQHELCVAARKFANLMVFGCWWFLNNPSIVREITLERVEMLGASFIPQHSDARILEQVIYKWRHSRKVIAGVLHETYSALALDGRPVTRAEIERDVGKMFSENFRRWVGAPEAATA
jgi:hypothetical protein